MPAGGPTYLRSTADNFEQQHHLRFLDYKEPSLQPTLPDDIEYKLHVTGLRKKRLWILLLCLVILTIITFIILIVSFFFFQLIYFLLFYFFHLLIKV